MIAVHRRNVQQPLDGLHLLLARPVPPLDQALLGSHAADVVIEHEVRGHDGHRSGVDRVGRLVHHHVKESAVVLVSGHLNILQGGGKGEISQGTEWHGSPKNWRIHTYCSLK